MNKFPDYKKVSTDSLIPYARNSRTHSDEQVSKIAASIKEFGFLNPVIIDGDNGIVAGHGRVMAAQKLGLAELPCIEASHLTDAQRRAYVIADNRLALDAGWDDDLLRIEIDDLSEMGFDLELIGFDVDEIMPAEDDTIGVADDKILDYLEAPLKTLNISIPTDLYDDFYDRIESYRNDNGLDTISEAIINKVMS